MRTFMAGIGTTALLATALAGSGAAVSVPAASAAPTVTPAITIEKTAQKAGDNAPIADRAFVPAGTVVTYVYTVTNTGDQTLSLSRSTAVVDDTCSPVTYVSGDSGDDEHLAPSEAWTYDCTQTLAPASSVQEITNTATVTSTWTNPDNPSDTLTITDTAEMTIGVERAANLRIIHATNPGDVDVDFGFNVTGPGVPVADQSFLLNSSAEATHPATRSIVLEVPANAGSQYVIAANGSTGWALTGVACSVTPDAVNLPAGIVTVTLMPEQDVTCTFTSERLPLLTVAKNSTPAGAGVEFPFTVDTPDAPSRFTLQDGGTAILNGLAPGAYSVTEGSIPNFPMPTGWNLDAIVCDHPHAVTGSKVTLDLDYGDDVECTFVNDQLPPATLVVMKDAEPSPWDPTFDFTASGTGIVTSGAPGSVDFGLGLGDSKQFVLHPGASGNTYTIDEQDAPTPPAGSSGFRLLSLACVVNADEANPISGNTDTGIVEVDLQPGDNAVCTYTNKQYPRLTIAKVAVDPFDPSNDSTFSFNATGLTPSTFSLKNSANQQAFTDLNVSSAFTVTETASANWTLTSLTCTGQGSGALTTSVADGSVSSDGLTYGDDVTCTFVNTMEPAKAYLVVLKNTDPARSGATFDFSATGTDLSEQFSVSSGGYTAFEVDPGFGSETYTITESPATGWNLASIQCSVSSDPSTVTAGDINTRTASVRLLSGEVGVCTFTNRKPASLTVDKVTDVASTTAFSFTAASTPTGIDPTSFSLTPGAPRVFDGVSPGSSVTLIETGTEETGERWTLADIQCDGGATAPTINVANGTASAVVGAAEDVECTYANVRVPPATVAFVASADPADGTSFDFTAAGQDAGSVPEADASFSLAPDDGLAYRAVTVYPRAAGEQFTFAEGALPAGWNLSDIYCQDDQSPVGTVSLGTRSVSVSIDPGDTLTCTFGIVADPTLTVIKQAPEDPDLAFDFAWDADPSTFQLSSQEARTAGGLTAGEFTVSEESIPTDWILASGEGTQPVCTGTNEAVDYSPASGATVTVAAGERAVCMFADFYEYDPQLRLTKTPDRTVVLDGQPVEYTYTLENVGSGTLRPSGNLSDIIADDKCGPVVYVSGGTPPTLSPGDTWTFACEMPMSTADATNIASATMVDGSDATVTATTRRTVEVRVPELGLAKAADATTVASGGTVTYTYVATNLGDTPFEGPQDRNKWLTDDKCSAVSYVTGDTGDDSILAVDEAWTYTCQVRLTTNTLNTGTFTATPFIPASPQSGAKQTGTEMQATAVALVRVSPGGGGATPPGDTGSGQTTDVPRNPALAVSKTASSRVAAVGRPVTYTYRVANLGAVPLSNIRVSDDRCSPVTYVSGDVDGDGLLGTVTAGEGWRDEIWAYTCTTRLSRTTTNTATVTGSPWWAGAVVGPDVSAQAKATVTVTSVLPIRVVPAPTCSGSRCTVITRSRTNKYGILTYRVRCRSLPSSATAGSPDCRSTLGRRGSFRVQVTGSRPVNVTVVVTAQPKPRYAGTWQPHKWKRTWILRP